MSVVTEKLLVRRFKRLLPRTKPHKLILFSHNLFK